MKMKHYAVEAYTTSADSLNDTQNISLLGATDLHCESFPSRPTERPASLLLPAGALVNEVQNTFTAGLPGEYPQRLSLPQTPL